jgi:hypothetical protein
MVGLIVIVIIIALLIGIFSRGKRTGDAWFNRPCPHCRQTIAMKATTCPWCGKDSVPPRWRWEKE